MIEIVMLPVLRHSYHKGRKNDLVVENVQNFKTSINQLIEVLIILNYQCFLISSVTSLCCRPGSDDVLVLKQEMITIQTLMDKMSQDSEREMEKLEGEYKILGAKHQE